MARPKHPRRPVVASALTLNGVLAAASRDARGARRRERDEPHVRVVGRHVDAIDELVEGADVASVAVDVDVLRRRAQVALGERVLDDAPHAGLPLDRLRDPQAQPR